MLSWRYRSAMAVTTSAIAIATATPAISQQDDQQAQGIVGLEEITVTARRVEENLQRVPIAISAFSEEKLVQQDIKDVFTLTKQLPGVNICCKPSNIFFTFVRGIGNGAPFYFAGAPIQQQQGLGNFLDIQNVQILKGPQGTLFGLASNGGAFVYEPRKPQNEFGGFINVSGGNLGRRSAEGAVNIPIVKDRVLFRMAAQSFYREGYVTDITTNVKLGDENFYVLRPSLTIRITDTIENNTIFQYAKSTTHPIPAGILHDFNFSPPSQLGILGLQSLFTGGSLDAFNALRDEALADQIRLGVYKVNGFSSSCATEEGPVFGPSFISDLDYDRVACPYSWTRNDRLINTTTWEFMDGFTLKNIFGYEWSKSFSQPNSVSGAPLLIFDSGHPLNTTPAKGPTSWSNEIQLQGELFDRVDFVFGYFHNGSVTHPLNTYGLAFGNFASLSSTKRSTWNHSVFGQANVDLGELVEGLTLTAGYRQSWDSIKSQSWNMNPTTGAVTAVVGGPTSVAGHANFSNGSYTLGLQYQFDADTMFFITNSKGYSSGGLQNVVGFEVFQPDSLNNLEAGVKSTFNIGDMTARLNASYFFGWFDNVKNPVAELVTNSVTGITNLVVVTKNASKAHIQGIEADLTVILTDWLEVGGFAGYTKDEYTFWQSINAQGDPIDLSSSPFLFVPEWKWSVRGTYRLPVDADWGDVSLTATFTHTGSLPIAALPKTPSDPNNPNTGFRCTQIRNAANGYGPLSADGGTAYVGCAPAYDNVDISLDWNNVLDHQGLSASFVINNVTKNEATDGQCGCDQALGVTSYIPAVPRTFYAQLRYAF